MDDEVVKKERSEVWRWLLLCVVRCVEVVAMADELSDEGRRGRRKLLVVRERDFFEGPRRVALDLVALGQVVVDRVEVPERYAGRRRCVERFGIGLRDCLL